MPPTLAYLARLDHLSGRSHFPDLPPIPIQRLRGLTPPRVSVDATMDFIRVVGVTDCIGVDEHVEKAKGQPAEPQDEQYPVLNRAEPDRRRQSPTAKDQPRCEQCGILIAPTSHTEAVGCETCDARIIAERIAEEKADDEADERETTEREAMFAAEDAAADLEDSGEPDDRAEDPEADPYDGDSTDILALARVAEATRYTYACTNCRGYGEVPDSQGRVHRCRECSGEGGAPAAECAA